MSNWKEVQNAMKAANTPQEKSEALRMLSENVPVNLKDKVLATMSKGGQNVVQLGDLANQANNPEVFERLKHVVAGK
jgi:hypothetical protein